MEWLTSNVFFVVILLLCIGMHLFGHSDHGNHDKPDRRDQHE